MLQSQSPFFILTGQGRKKKRLAGCPVRRCILVLLGQKKILLYVSWGKRFFAPTGNYTTKMKD
jgi:hypothetical protein